MHPTNGFDPVNRRLLMDIIEELPGNEIVMNGNEWRHVLAALVNDRSRIAFAELVLQGLDRFLADGRIDRYPANQTQRYELLQWISKQVLIPGLVIDESAFNERLVKYTDDVAVLRRHHIDAELVERTPNGTAYSLVQAVSHEERDCPGIR